MYSENWSLGVELWTGAMSRVPVRTSGSTGGVGIVTAVMVVLGAPASTCCVSNPPAAGSFRQTGTVLMLIEASWGTVAAEAETNDDIKQEHVRTSGTTRLKDNSVSLFKYTSQHALQWLKMYMMEPIVCLFKNVSQRSQMVFSLNNIKTSHDENKYACVGIFNLGRIIIQVFSNAAWLLSFNYLDSEVMRMWQHRQIKCTHWGIEWRAPPRGPARDLRLFRS